VGLLVVLVACNRQVIAAYPDGGGAYTVALENFGVRAGLVAVASLIVDYVLNVAVSIAAGIAALTSAFPRLLPDTTLLCVGALVVVTAVNLRGVLTSAKLFICPNWCSCSRSRRSSWSAWSAGHRSIRSHRRRRHGRSVPSGSGCCWRPSPTAARP